MKKKKIWKKLIFFLIAFSLFSFNFISCTNLKYKFKINYQGENLLKSSDTEISIITPENKTYTEPMSGYYTATYGFEEDQIGTSGTDIKFIDSKEAGAVATIVAEANNHKNILRYSTPSDFEAIWDDLSDNQSTGTVEFWINCAETNERHNIIIRGPMGNRILFDFYSNGMIQYLNYSVWHPIWPYEVNRWYHVKIAFDCDIYGDGTNDWHLWIDGMNMDGGVGYGYDGAPMTLNQVIFQGTSGADFDIDAVGYSWDPKYNIGDNLNEGLLLSFETHLSLNWIGYSLDGQANKTIQGNKTIPLPENGLHKIQFYCELPTGELIESNVRHFTINYNPEEPYIPPYELPNDFHILITVFIGALSIFLGVLLILYVILTRRRKYELYKFKEPKKPEIRVKSKYGYLICPYCHNENRIKNNYCIYCGASLIEFKPDNT